MMTLRQRIWTVALFGLVGTVVFGHSKAPPPSQSSPVYFKEGPSPTPSFSLKFVHEQILKQGLSFQKIPVGGLSALTYDSQNRVFLALSDDKGNKGFPPRFYKLRLLNKNLKPHLKLIDQVVLRDSKGNPFIPIDPEGMVILYDHKLKKTHKTGHLFISSEGAQMPSLKAPPQIFKFNTKGDWLSSMPVWDVYWRPDQIGQWGVKENKGFEALSVDPLQKHIYFATEQALHQDVFQGDVFQNRQYIRITKWDLKNKAKAIKYKQYLYPMNIFMEKDNMKGLNGLTDFISLGDQKLIVVERAYLKKKKGSNQRKMDANWVRLFLADCSQASNVAKYKNLNQLARFNKVLSKKILTCGKTLISDLSTLSHIKVDNIEGIALGPQISKGKYWLVLVSDNNFSLKQKNQFLFFHFQL